MLLITDLCVQSDLSMTDKFVIADVTAGFFFCIFCDFFPKNKDNEHVHGYVT